MLTKSETFPGLRVRSEVSLDSQIPAGLGGQRRKENVADVASDHVPEGGKNMC